MGRNTNPPDRHEKQTCIKCRGTKNKDNFFLMTRRGNVRCNVCKHCLTQDIRNDDIDTFLWILEEFDVPYIKQVWIDTANKVYLKNPAQQGSPVLANSIGTYLRSMGMTQYNKYSYADSDMLNAEWAKAANSEFEPLPPTKKPADYNDIPLADEVPVVAKPITFVEPIPQEPEPVHEPQPLLENPLANIPAPTSSPPEETVTAEQQSFVAGIQVDENELRKNLTEEDIKYLGLKWGIYYKPSQWIKLEELYQKYAAEYELNTDREETVKKICKTSMKMDEALDIGDISSYKNLSGVFDQLRKSAKLTEQQNKEEVVREMDTVGELVAFVEKEGGIIPHQFDPIEYPQDIVDFCIKDIQNYINHLIRGELGLGDLIESYIEKLENQKNASIEDIKNTDFDHLALTEEEAENFEQFRLDEIEEEALKLAESGALDLDLANYFDIEEEE